MSLHLTFTVTLGRGFLGSTCSVCISLYRVRTWERQGLKLGSGLAAWAALGALAICTKGRFGGCRGLRSAPEGAPCLRGVVALWSSFAFP